MTTSITARYNSLYGNDETPFGMQPSPFVPHIPRYIPKGKILDLGCGYGRDTLFLAQFPELEIHAIDISEEAITLLNKELAHQPGAVRAWVNDVRTFNPIYTYDCVILSYVLHHLSFIEAVTLLDKVKGWTVDGGLNVVTTFTDEGDAHFTACSAGKDDFYPNPEWMRMFYQAWDIEFLTHKVAQMHQKHDDGTHFMNERVSVFVKKTTA